MRKTPLILGLLLVFTLLLSACAGGNNGNGSNMGTTTPGDMETQAIPNTGATEGLDMNTPTVDSTPAVDVTEAVETATEDAAGSVTEEVTEEATEAVTEDTTPTAGAEGGADTTPTAKSGNETGGGQAGGSGDGVIGIPQTGSAGYVGLAAMMDWEVVGADGSQIGTVQDYVVNTCEAHILYLVVDPAEGVSSQGGQQILIPFEAVLGELNEGSSVDVDQRVFTLKQNVSDLSAVPGVDVETIDLENPDWSEEILTYWEENDYRLSVTAGCPVPVSGEQGEAGGSDQQATPEATPGATQDATTQPTVDATPTAESTLTPDTGAGTSGDRQIIYRLALASKLLNAELQEGNGRLLGTVQDVAIVPETGRTQFFVVDTAELDQTGDRMVALPPGAVNISYENSADQPAVVLLVDTAILQDAPNFDESAGNSDSDWFNFWNQHIPMTREAMP